MPETNETVAPTSEIKTKKRNERTEAKFLEDVDRVIAEAERQGAAYQPPNPAAALANLKAKRAQVQALRTAHQANAAAIETSKNARENLYASLNSDISSLVEYARSTNPAANELAALKSLSRSVKGVRAAPVAKGDTAAHISVAQLSFASRAENYAQFIEQYDTLDITTTEANFQTATHRAKLDALRDANQTVINRESAADTSGEHLDKVAYLADDSLLKGALAAKSYIKSKHKNDQAFKNISKTRLVMPSRLRKK